MVCRKCSLDESFVRVELLFEANPIFIYFVPCLVTKSISSGFQGWMICDNIKWLDYNTKRKEEEGGKDDENKLQTRITLNTCY